MPGGEDQEGMEERAIESQLEIQLDEQRQSILALDEALKSDLSNLDLHSVREELLQSIHETEEGILHLKRARLLREADDISSKLVDQSTTRENYENLAGSSQLELGPLVSPQFHVGSKCRFLHPDDGHWYNGHIVELEEGALARVAFMNPTSENMLICKFHLQQRCRFGTTCRLSHGNCVSISSLKQYVPTVWQQSLVGSSVWALSNDHSGIWIEVTLEKWDDKLKLARVLFRDGTCAKVDTDCIALSQFAQMSDEDDEEEESSLEGIESSECEDEDFENESSIHGGVGFLQSSISQSGIQKETALFATWENHTRGIASKMMANMGYCEGMGLGASGQGIVDPIIVKSLPPKQSLDHAVQSNDKRCKKDGDKKRSRGGKRKRNKKFAEAARAAKGGKEAEPNVFSFINDQLAGQKVNTEKSRKKERSGGVEMQEDSMKKEDNRQSLVAHDHKIKELKLQAVRLEEMMRRNLRNDKVVYDAASRKLNETRRDLRSAEAAHASASNAVVSKEREKKWLKF